MGYGAEFYRYWSNGTSVRMDIRRKKLGDRTPPLKNTDRSDTCDFLLTSRSIL